MSNDSCVVVVGKESAGKSQLISSLTGRSAYSANFRGTTLACDVYRGAGFKFVDTPGIMRQSDSVTTRTALGRLQGEDTVLLVVRGTRLDEDLADMLPILKDRRGVVAVTFWDKVRAAEPSAALTRICAELGAPLVPLDARRLSSTERADILEGLANPSLFARVQLSTKAGWCIEPAKGPLDTGILGVLLAILLTFAPALVAVWTANAFAAVVDALLQPRLAALASSTEQLPKLVAGVIAGPYGLLTMGPLLFIWAVPTVVTYALFIGLYKTSGLIDRINVVMHPIVRPLGLAGRDLTRIMMGFGCNVPAVVSTRSCSSCSRGTAVTTIAFGSACSYQLGATLSVFGAAGAPWLVAPYLAFLVVTTILYARASAPAQARSRVNLLLIEGRGFLEWPRWSAVWREASSTLSQFFGKALPIFLGISVLASVLDAMGVVDSTSSLLGPAMGLFDLPREAALPILMASIRKDGILMFSNPEVMSKMNSGQVLTGVYLAGVFLPCLVTVLTIARELSAKFAARLLVRHVAAALIFTLVLGWGAAILESW